MELPQTPPCGPQFGVRRINLFRVGGEAAIGPGSSRCGAERGEPPILHAWARGPCPPAASLSAPLPARPAFSAPRPGARLLRRRRRLPGAPAVLWGAPDNWPAGGEAGRAGPRRVSSAWGRHWSTGVLVPS